MTNHHFALPRAFLTDTTELLMVANEFSPRDTGDPPRAPLAGDGAETQMEEIAFPRTHNPSAAEHAKCHCSGSSPRAC